MPTGLHPHAHRLSLPHQITVKLFCFLAVWQSSLSTISSFGIHKRNLLEARVIIASYNDHCRLLSTRAFLVGLASTKVYSGMGAGVVMESITRFDRWSMSVTAISRQL